MAPILGYISYLLGTSKAKENLNLEADNSGVEM
jgi:hypothetical protein